MVPCCAMPLLFVMSFIISQKISIMGGGPWEIKLHVISLTSQQEHPTFCTAHSFLMRSGLGQILRMCKCITETREVPSNLPFLGWETGTWVQRRCQRSWGDFKSRGKSWKWPQCLIVFPAHTQNLQQKREALLAWGVGGQSLCNLYWMLNYLSTGVTARKASLKIKTRPIIIECRYLWLHVLGEVDFIHLF